MIKNVHLNELLFSDLLVKEPVDKVNEAISGSCNKKVILAGSRGSGKSVVLGSRELQSLRTENPAIYTRFDACGMFGKKDDDVFNSDFMKHYYEIIMSNKILNYIKKFYPEVYGRYFQKDEDLVISKLRAVDHYIRNAYYKKVDLGEQIHDKAITSEILDKSKKTLGASSVELMIDRFDWTHNSDERVQNILAGYFDLFDRTIITSDDQRFESNDYWTQFDDKGFDVYGVEYSRSDEVIREIVRRRIELGKEFDESGESFIYPIDSVRAETIERMIEQTGGNISLILESFMEAENLYQWDKPNFDADKTVEKACTYRLEHNRQFRSMAAPQILHL